MSGRSLLGTAATAILVALVVGLLAGQVLGQPVLVGYVTTDSMEPTIDAGDGFVAVPSFLAGEPEVGDVVVYDARELHDSGLTTHRIVGETEGGYVTKGDANPFTDQDDEEPPVTDGQIVAHALQVDGGVITIPHLGTAVETVQATVAAPFGVLDQRRAGTVLVALGIALFLLAGTVGERGRRDTRRSRNRPDVVAIRTVVLVAVVVVAGAATAAMVLPAGVHEFGVVASEDPTGEPHVVEPGGTATVTYETHNGGLLPVLVITEPASGGTAVEPRDAVLGGGERVETTVTMAAPSQPDAQFRHVRESRYLLLLPPRVVAALHSIHPLLALLAVDAVVGAFVVSASVAVFGTGHLRLRSRGDRSLATRLRRRLR